MSENMSEKMIKNVVPVFAQKVMDQLDDLLKSFTGRDGSVNGELYVSLCLSLATTLMYNILYRLMHCASDKQRAWNKDVMPAICDMLNLFMANHNISIEDGHGISQFRTDFHTVIKPNVSNKPAATANIAGLDE